MGIELLAGALTGFLSPFLPYLLDAGREAAGEIGKTLGSKSGEWATRIWGKLRETVEQRPAAAEAARDVANAPDDEDARASFRLQLRKLLESDATLVEELEALVEQGNRDGAQIVVGGQRNVVIGRDATGNVIITGDDRTT